MPAPVTLEAIVVAVSISKVTIYASLAVIVAVSLSASHGTLVVEFEIGHVFIYICFSDLRSHKISLLQVRLKSRCLHFTIIKKYINSIEIRILLAPTVTTARALKALIWAVIGTLNASVTIIIAPLWSGSQSHRIYSSAFVGTGVHFLVNTIKAVGTLVAVIRTCLFSEIKLLTPSTVI